LGSIGLQVLSSGDGDADTGGHGDFDADADVDLDADLDHDVGADSHGVGGVDHLDGFLPIFLSLRFWTFAFAGFGIVGTLLHFFNLMDRTWVPLVAGPFGLGAGFVSGLIFRALARSEVSSGASTKDAIGQVGKVLLPLDRQRRGKVRIEVRGQILDMIATTEEGPFEAGDTVMVVEMRDDGAHVAGAPAELAPQSKK
jgi:membrane protein implicated in regulation of membrane protease activity